MEWQVTQAGEFTIIRHNFKHLIINENGQQIPVKLSQLLEKVKRGAILREILGGRQIALINKGKICGIYPAELKKFINKLIQEHNTTAEATDTLPKK